MDFKKFAETLGLEENEFTELAELFLDTCVGDLERLDAAVTNDQAKEVARAAHSIKGAAGNLGFMELSDIAKTIEANAQEGNLDNTRENIAAFREKLGELEKIVRGIKQ